MIDIKGNTGDTLAVTIRFSLEQVVALHHHYGLTPEDLVFNAVNNELGYLYETYLNGEKAKADDSSKSLHCTERPVCQDGNPSGSTTS